MAYFESQDDDMEGISTTKELCEELAEERLFTNVKLKVGNDNILTLHKAVLASKSKYFWKVFEYREGSANVDQPIDLDEGIFDGDSILADFILKKCIYLNQYALILKDIYLFRHVAKILHICQFLCLHDLYDNIIDILPFAAIRPDNFVHFWQHFSVTSKKALKMCQVIGSLLFSHGDY